MAAQMRDHGWSTKELLRYRVPPAELRYPQVAREEGAVAVGSSACSLSTIRCGATQFSEGCQNSPFRHAPSSYICYYRGGC